MADTNTAKMVRRSQRVAFMNTGTAEAPKYERMTKFTSLGNSKNPKEYTRHYIDEDNECSDVVGYAPSISYAFDRHTNTPVHEKLCDIHDRELLGDDTHVDIIIVDLFTKDADKKCTAVKRTCAVIPSNDGEGTEALIYSGTFKTVSAIEIGTAVVSDDGKNATYEKPTA